MAHHFREPERRQVFLLPADMMDWLPEGDIVHLIVDAVAMMDLDAFEAGYRLGRAGQAPFAPQVLLALPPRSPPSTLTPCSGISTGRWLAQTTIPKMQ